MSYGQYSWLISIKNGASHPIVQDGIFNNHYFRILIMDGMTINHIVSIDHGSYSFKLFWKPPFTILVRPLWERVWRKQKPHLRDLRKAAQGLRGRASSNGDSGLLYRYIIWYIYIYILYILYIYIYKIHICLDPPFVLLWKWWFTLFQAILHSYFCHFLGVFF